MSENNVSIFALRPPVALTLSVLTNMTIYGFFVMKWLRNNEKNCGATE